MFVDKLAVNNTVTPEEALKLWQYRTTADLCIVKEIRDLYEKVETQPEPMWRYMKLLSIVWNAGRVQGIREERHKHKHR